MSRNSSKPLTILIVDDDADDRQMIAEAFQENRLANELKYAEDGEQLMDYLCRRGEFKNPATSPRPGLILLDLNMPKKMVARPSKRSREIPSFVISLW